MLLQPAAAEGPLLQRRNAFSPVRQSYPTVATASVQFGKTPSTRRLYIDPLTGRIDGDIYKLISQAPKNELHIHQGGSTSVEFMTYVYRRAIQDGTILQYLGNDQSLPIYHQNGLVERVSLVDKQGQLLPEKQLTQIMERVLTQENMREYLRVDSINENQKGLIPNRELSETTEGIQSTGFNEETIDKIKDVALKEYLVTTGKMNPFNRNPAAAYLIANMYAKEVAFENVRYAEYRVSASGNGYGGNKGAANLEQTLSAVSAGFEDAKSYLGQRLRKFDYGLIVLLERQNRSSNDSPDAKVERAKQTATEVVRLKKEGKYNIVGVDLAGDEARNPVTEFAEAFKIIQDYNAGVPADKRLGITIHAGETARSQNPSKNLHLDGWQSVEQALRVGHDTHTPFRIGHGLQVINSSPALKKAFETYLAHPDDWEQRINIRQIYAQSPVLRYIRDNKVLLEMCPKSNLQTYGIHPGFVNAQDTPDEKYTARSYKRHPAVFLSRLGVKVALSGDNRTVSNTDTPNEYVKLYKYAGLTYQDFKKMVLNGFESAFVAEPQKSMILEEVQRKFRAMEKEPDMIRAINKMDNHISPEQKWILVRERLQKSVSGFFRTILNWIRPNSQTQSA